MQDFLSFNGIIFVPVAIFIISAFIAFGTGTSCGTIAIVTPFYIDIALHIWLENINISTALAAVLSGSLFGDHSSSISDTTIISASSAKCSLYRHFIAQLPFALIASICAMIGLLQLNSFAK